MLRKDALFNCFSAARTPMTILFGQERAKSLIERNYDRFGVQVGL